MKILVTGGLGFIGSHTVVELINEGFEVVIVDNLSNSQIEVLTGIENILNKSIPFYNLDLRDKKQVEDFCLQNSDIEGVIHFAAFKAVGESVEKPLSYYENNISALVYLLQGLLNVKCNAFIFSSSCTVYGQADELPITENAPIKKAESPYGNTKKIGEDILQDVCKSNPEFNAIALRYFNPIGAHSSSEIGELPIGIPQNLVPFITQTAAGIRDELKIFGRDYPTPDGTCIRDYLHVSDLARAHVSALLRISKKKTQSNFEVFNLGTGNGNSVLEMVKAFESATGQKLNFSFADRRQGDVVAAYASTEKAKKELEWQTEISLEKSLQDAWNWQKKISNS